MVVPESNRHIRRRVHIPGVVPEKQAPQQEAILQRNSVHAPPLSSQASNADTYTGASHRMDYNSQAPAAEQLQALEDSINVRFTELIRQIQGVQAVSSSIRADEEGRIGDELRTKSAEIQDIRTRAQAEVHRSFAQKREDTQRLLETHIRELAPGNLGQPSGVRSDVGTPNNFSAFVRVGTLTNEKIPALLPLIATRHWYVEGPSQVAHELILNSLARYAGHLPVKHVKFLVFDPRISGGLAALSPLRSINGATFPQAFSSADAFADALEQAIDTAARNVERTAIQGVDNILELWNSTGVPDGEVTVAVILDQPYGQNEQLHKTIERALRVPPSSGLTVIIHQGTTNDASENNIPRQAHVLKLTYAREKWDCSDIFGENNDIVADPVVTPAVLKDLFDVISQKVAAIQGPTYPLEDLIAENLSEPWRASSADSLDALIGKSGQQDLIVSFRSENPATPNMLVGGAVGQGKSNLLLDIIFSLATKYSPDEMELLLLDFKRGLEFKRFDKNAEGTGWMPHVKVLSLESNQEFGVAVLRYVENELERRSQLFKQNGAHAITDFRAAGKTLPRVLLIIDEFHVLFEGDDQKTEEAVALLETIAKQGRAYGIHILLASQTTSGISGLRVKGESIYAQFAMRMSLKNTVQESQAILSQHNSAAADLTYRGEVIFNKNFGQDPQGSNIRGIAAWVNADRFAQVQQRLWEIDHKEEPLVFIGSDFAAWKKEQFDLLRPRTDGVIEGWIGRPIAITDIPTSIELDTDINQGVALVGTGDEVADNVLVSFAITALQTMEKETKVTVLCGLNSLLPQVERLVAQLRQNGREVNVIGRKDIPEYLVNTVVAKLDSGEEAPTLILGLGMQRIPGMEKSIQSDGDGFDFSFDAVNTGKDALMKLTRDGALQKMFFVGWWSSLEGVRNQLDYNRVGISKYLFLKVGGEDIRDIAGPQAVVSQDYPRVTLFDTASDEGLLSLVPFDSVPDYLWGSDE